MMATDKTTPQARPMEGEDERGIGYFIFFSRNKVVSVPEFGDTYAYHLHSEDVP